MTHARLFYKIFKSADELERLNIKYNIALVTFFNEKQDLPRFPEFVDILLRSSLSWDYYCLVAQIVMDNQLFCLLRLPLDKPPPTFSCWNMYFFLSCIFVYLFITL